VSTLEKRLEALERLLGGAPEEDSEDLKRRREEMKASWPRAWQRRPPGIPGGASPWRRSRSRSKGGCRPGARNALDGA
jgi:hypothetical protein